ncbi:MAG: molybdopterin molybdenumtransferase MoeA, partial [Alphaproteobacteria bacterium]|nr:molybdopterin molybdenumtransferase MoeA [Alphaproteobacteria bacterium]
MAKAPVLAVADALARILASADRPLASESVPLAQAHGRRLAAPLAAKRMQPPWPVSAMDGYAVRHADLATLPATLTMTGTSAAGHAFEGSVNAGECVRIFTGAPVPDGADTIVIQEDAQVDGARIAMREIGAKGHYVRAAGLDFKAGDELLEAGRKLGPAE